MASSSATPYDCKLCDKVFPSNRGLRIHQGKCHDGKQAVPGYLPSDAIGVGVGARMPRVLKADNALLRSLLVKKKPEVSSNRQQGPSSAAEVGGTSDMGLEGNAGANAGFSQEGPEAIDLPIPVLHELPEPHPLPSCPTRGRPSNPVPLHDVLPTNSTDAEEVPIHHDHASEPTPKRPRLTLVLRRWRTKFPGFSLVREFYGRPPVPPPVIQPANRTPLLPLPPSDQLPPPHSPQIDQSKLREALGPFPNYSTFRYAQWILESPSGRTSAALSNEFTRKILKDPLWKSDDVAGLELNALKDRIARWEPTPLDPQEGWKQKEVIIDVPLGGGRKSAVPSQPFSVGYLNFRGLVPLVRKVIATDPNVKDFYLNPFCEYQTRKDGSNIRVFGECASADRFREYHEEVQRLPPVDGCRLERVVLAFMLWSDATLLAQFGLHKLWPIYLAFANQPRWQRFRPSMGAWHDLAHIPQFPKSFQDFVKNYRQRGADKNLMAHCRREMFQAVWDLILDDEFMEAYKHGIVLDFPDGIKRRVFLRFLTYSADYPEKILIACVRDLGNCPCPRCFITMKMVRELGTTADDIIRFSFPRQDDISHAKVIDTARSYIYNDGYIVKAKRVEEILQPTSLVPTKSAFSKLRPFGFNVFSFLAVDLLHEVELGVWKALLAHLIRMLYSLGADYVQEMDKRYRSVTPFGRDTIRTISYNTSELKQLAARDYEDLLQCSIPVFEGLFPELSDDTAIVDLLYTLTDWHALAKLAVHTEETLTYLSEATTLLGEQLRHFSDVVCKGFKTVETPAEFAKRKRKAAKSNTSNPTATQRLPKTFNLETFKLHSLGYYAPDVRACGSTENYSTQPGEAHHKKKKIQYALTNKNQFEKQIAQRTVVSENIRIVDTRVSELLCGTSKPPQHQTSAKKPRPSCTPTAPQLQATIEDSLRQRYDISDDEKHYLNFNDFISQYKEDPAMKDFRLGLLDHLVSRLRNSTYSWDTRLHSPHDYTDISLSKHRLYFHQTMRLNFTSYDMLRRQDTLKPFLHITQESIKPDHSQRCYIMLASSDSDRGSDEHRFWYAQVLAILHVKARLRSTEEGFRHIDLLWVRWLGRDYDSPAGLNAKRLDKVGFLEDEAFGFVNPSDVIRASHMIPSFGEQRTGDLLAARHSFVQDSEGDWSFYQVNRHVDRDMYMRYRGGGIGHSDSAQFAPAEVYNTSSGRRDSLPPADTGAIASMIPRSQVPENYYSDGVSDGGGEDSISGDDVCEETLLEDAEEFQDSDSDEEMGGLGGDESSDTDIDAEMEQ